MDSIKKENDSEHKEEMSLLGNSMETKILQLIAKKGVPITIILYAFFSIFMPKLFDFVEKRFYEIRTENQRILDVHQKMEENQIKLFEQINNRILNKLEQIESKITKDLCKQ